MSVKAFMTRMVFPCTDDNAKSPNTLNLIDQLGKQPLVSLEECIQPLITIVPDIVKTVNFAKDLYNRTENGLTLDESTSIRLYTMTATPDEHAIYYILNKTLRGGDEIVCTPWFRYLRLLQSALSKIPSSNGQTVYRGIKSDVNKEYPVGRVALWPGLTSTSLRVQVIKDFLGQEGPRTLFIIKCNSGKNIRQHSTYDIEEELLLFAYTPFEVVENVQQGNEFHIIHLQEIETAKASLLISNPAIFDYVKTCSLRSKIDLSERNLTDAYIKLVFEQATVEKECTELCLQNNMITSHGISTITSTLDTSRTLTKLWLDANEISDDGVSYLGIVLSNNRSCLQCLGLSSNQITDVGAERLADMLKRNTTLTILKLCANKIGDQGFTLLADVLIKSNTTLQSVDLSENKRITDVSIRDVSQVIKRNQTLISLYLFECNLSENGKRSLKPLEEFRPGFNLGL